MMKHPHLLAVCPPAALGFFSSQSLFCACRGSSCLPPLSRQTGTPSPSHDRMTSTPAAAPCLPMQCCPPAYPYCAAPCLLAINAMSLIALDLRSASVGWLQVLWRASSGPRRLARCVRSPSGAWPSSLMPALSCRPAPRTGPTATRPRQRRPARRGARTGGHQRASSSSREAQRSPALCWLSCRRTCMGRSRGR